MFSLLAQISIGPFVIAFFTMIAVGVIVGLLFWALKESGLKEPFNRVLRLILIFFAVLACIGILLWVLAQLSGPAIFRW
jgi:peptidoglycan biosynthesis protein MviN/MurJ (putative lipid II flippase)